MKTEELIDLLRGCAEKNCPVCSDIESCTGPSWLLRKAADELMSATAFVNRMWAGVDTCLPSMKIRVTEDGRECLESDYVLVWDGLKVEIAQAVSDESSMYWLDRCADVVTAVSWMPLPTPPEQAEGDD